MYDHILHNDPGQAHRFLSPHLGLHYYSNTDLSWIYEIKYHLPYSDGQPEGDINYPVFSSNKVLGIFIGFSKTFY
jgi:hypothetical protein